MGFYSRKILAALTGMAAACYAQDDFGDDRMDEPVDLESLLEDYERSFRHENDVDSLEDDATYIEQTILALQQLGLVLSRLQRMNGLQLFYKETDNCEQHHYSVSFSVFSFQRFISKTRKTE